LHIAQQMPLPLTISCSSKSRLVLTCLVLPFWYVLIHNQVNWCSQKSDTISQEDVDHSNHEPTEEQKEICQKVYLQNANVRVWLPKLKAIPKKNIKQQIRIVEAVMVTMKMAEISKTNALVYVCATLVTERLNVKPQGSHMQKEPSWNEAWKKDQSSEQTSANCRNGRMAYWRKRKRKIGLTECTRLVTKVWMLPQKK